MKKIFAVCAVAALFAACGTKGTQVAPATDSVAVDSVVVADTVVADTVADSVCLK